MNNQKETVIKGIDVLNKRLMENKLSLSILTTMDKGNVYMLIHTKSMPKKKVKKIVGAVKLFGGERLYDEMLMIPNDASLTKTEEFVSIVTSYEN